MEVLTYTQPATKKLEETAHVGVVGSGDLEVLIAPNEQSESHVTIRTGINGFQKIWDSVIEQFFEDYKIAANIQINDFGATPGVVKLRLAQVMEVSGNE